MAKDLIIIGAAQDGRVAAEVVEDIGNKWNLLGYLDDDPKKQSIEINAVPVLGKTADIAKYDNCYFIVVLGSPRDYSVKKKIITKLGISLENYATIIHPSAIVSKYANIGRGSVIYPGVTIMANAEIGNHVFIASKTNVGHDTKIGDYVTISTLAAIAGNVTVEEGCYIGLNSSIRDGVTIGEWSLIGMGSVVVSDVPAYHVAVPNRARIMRKTESAEL